MEKIKILHTGDFHLDAPFNTIGEIGDKCREELLLTFGKVIDIAKESLVDMIVISGDLYDNTNPSYHTVDYVCRKLNEIPEIPVFIATGNHDYITDVQYPDNVKVFGKKTECYTVNGCNIYGISFPSRYVTECNIRDFTANADKTNIFVLHGDLVGMGMKSEYNPITPLDLDRCNIDYFALGHIHKYSGLQKINNTYYAYCGTPYGHGFDETGEKGVIISEIEKGNVTSRFIPVAKRKYTEAECDISVCENIDEAIDIVRKEISGKNDLYKIILKGETSFKADEKIILHILSDECFYLKIYNETYEKIDVKKLSNERTLKGIFVKNAMDNERALRFGLSALNGEKYI